MRMNEQCAAWALVLALPIGAPLIASERVECVETFGWAEDGPSAREHASVMVFDDRVVVYAGSGYEPQGQPLSDAWAYDITDRSWSSLAIKGDAPTAGGSKRVSQNGDSCFLFGGYGQSFAPSNELHRVRLDGDTLRFEPVEQVSPPPPRALHAFAYDPKSERFIAALGVAPTGFFEDTWIGTLDEDGRVVWREIDGAPSARFGCSFGFDTSKGELVVHSGQVPPRPDAPMVMTDELWVLDVRADEPAWRRIDLTDAPTGRRNATFAYDDAHDRLLAWCGTADGRTNIGDLVIVERDAAGEWTASSVADDDASPRRSSGFGFVDPGTGRLYLGFGNSAQGRFRDWVVFDVE